MYRFSVRQTRVEGRDRQKRKETGASPSSLALHSSLPLVSFFFFSLLVVTFYQPSMRAPPRDSEWKLLWPPLLVPLPRPPRSLPPRLIRRPSSMASNAPDDPTPLPLPLPLPPVI